MELGEKSRYFLKILLAVIGVYILFKYMLVLFLPFVIAYALSFFLTPIVNYLTKVTRIKRGIITFVVLTIVLVILGLLIALLVITAVNQLMDMVNNSRHYEKMFYGIVDDACCTVERYFGVDKNKVFEYVSSNVETFWNGYQKESIVKLMDTSAMTIMAVVKILIFIFTAAIATFYMVVSREEIRKKKSESIFYKEISAVMGNVYKVSVSYIRTQLIIMFFTTLICYGGLLIIKNKYALIIALVVGVLDALPLFGVGAVLVPWGIILLIMGNYYHGAVIFIVFVICYVLREVAEPRLMGHGIGISPLMTIVAMYVGFELFGIAGVLLGPIAYVVLRTIINV